MIVDNGEAHKGEGVCELVEGSCCPCCSCQPAYSPTSPPAEKSFSKIKLILRRIEARIREALVEAIGRALEAMTGDTVGNGARTAAMPSNISRYEKRCKSGRF